MVSVFPLLAYWGCRSNEATVTVRSEVKFNLTCPSGVLSKQKQGTNDYETEEFELYVEFHQGSDITSLTWKQDTQPLGSKITNVAGKEYITHT